MEWLGWWWPDKTPFEAAHQCRVTAMRQLTQLKIATNITVTALWWHLLGHILYAVRQWWLPYGSHVMAVMWQLFEIRTSALLPFMTSWRHRCDRNCHGDHRHILYAMRQPHGNFSWQWQFDDSSHGAKMTMVRQWQDSEADVRKNCHPVALKVAQKVFGCQVTAAWMPLNGSKKNNCYSHGNEAATTSSQLP